MCACRGLRPLCHWPLVEPRYLTCCLGQESLGGNSRTSLVVNCSPAFTNRDETMSTLRFGVRAKRMVNKPRANKERSAAELKAALELKEVEIARLKRRVAALEGMLPHWHDCPPPHRPPSPPP